MSTPRRHGEIRDINGNIIKGATIIRQSKPRNESLPVGSLNPAQADMQNVQQIPSNIYPSYDEGRNPKGRAGTYSTMESLMHKVVFHCIDAEGTPVANLSLRSDSSLTSVDGVSDLNGTISFYLPAGESHLSLGGKGVVKKAKMIVPKEIAFTPRNLTLNIERESSFTYFVDSGVLLEGEINLGNPGNTEAGWLARNLPLVAATGISVLVIYLAMRGTKEPENKDTV